MHLFFISGFGMLGVALLAAILWRRWTVAGWRWFWVGAGIWSAGVVGKGVWSVIFNRWLFRSIDDWPSTVHSVVGAAYVGVSSAFWEIGITAIAALRWRAMALTPDRAAGVGVGAGSFEAGLLGTALTVSVALAVLGGPGGQEIAESLAHRSEQTPLAWLAGPVERVIAVLLHVATRMLVLLAVLRERWGLFWTGFGLFSFADGIVGYVIVTETLSITSLWWIELALLPVAVASLSIIGLCYRRWPSASGAGT